MIEPRIDAALLALRVGLAGACVLLFTLRQAGLAALFAGQPVRLLLLGILGLCALLTACGFGTRIASVVMAALWLWALYSGLHAGAPWFGAPTRALELVIAYSALVMAGPGRFVVRLSRTK